MSMPPAQLAMALLAGLSCLPALAGAPFDFDAAPGRLPKNVVPLDYSLAVVPDIDAGTIAGTESVKLRVRTPSRTNISSP